MRSLNHSYAQRQIQEEVGDSRARKYQQGTGTEENRAGNSQGNKAVAQHHQSGDKPKQRKERLLTFSASQRDLRC